MLLEAGWVLQDMKNINLGVAKGIVVQEYPLEGGEHADYVMFLDRLPVGVSEAKKEGAILIQAEEKTESYAKGQLKWLSTEEIRNLDLAPADKKILAFLETGIKKGQARA